MHRFTLWKAGRPLLTGLLVLRVVAGLDGEGLVVADLSGQHQNGGDHLEEIKIKEAASVASDIGSEPLKGHATGWSAKWKQLSLAPGSCCCRTER